MEQAMKKPGGKKSKGRQRSPPPGQFAEEFGAQTAQQERLKKAEAMAHALNKAKAQDELADFLQQRQATHLHKRDNIAEKRKGMLQQQMALKGGSQYQPTVTQEAFPNSGVLHRHIHHHMHYHSEGDETGAPRSVEHLPQLVNTDGFRGGINPGIRRNQSDSVLGTAGPSSTGYTPLVHSASTGQVLPNIAGRGRQ